MTDSAGGDKATTEDLSGRTLAGRFLVRTRLAAGAHGVVWRATQEPLGRDVAIKVLREDAADPHADERLRREGEALAALRHENLVAIYDAGRTERGAPFVVMELVAGPSVRALLDRGPLSWRDAASIALGVGRALEAAHGAGVVHRDLKPENILLANDPSTSAYDPRAVRVVDFGLAKSLDGTADPSLSASAVLRGTPAYMSPEQANGRGADARSDLYALGIVLYELLTGANPFRAETALKTLVRHTEGPRPPAPSSFAQVPSALDVLTLSLLAVDPAARPARAHDVVRALEALLASEPVGATVAPAPSVAPPSRMPLGVAIGAALGVAFVVFVLALGVRPSPPDAPSRADAGSAARASEDAGAPASILVDAGVSARASPTADAGPGVRAPADKPRPRASPIADAGVAASAPAAPALLRKLDYLRTTCVDVVPCAARLPREYEAAVGRDLEALKRVRDDVDACVAACATARDHGQ